MITKCCPRCETVKLVTEFHRNQARKDGLCNWCKLCNSSTAVLKRKKENPDKVRTRVRRYSKTQKGREARRRVGRKLSNWPAPLFALMMEVQGGLCATCSVKMLPSGRLPTSVTADHDHVSGLPRGILCRACNANLDRLAETSARHRNYIDGGYPVTPALKAFAPIYSRDPVKTVISQGVVRVP